MLRLPYCLLLLLPALVCMTVPAQSVCDGRFTGDTVAGGNEYDPFDALDFRRRQSVSVRNTGSQACDFVIGFRRQPSDAMLGPALHYRLDDSGGNPLLSDKTPLDSARYLVVTNLQPAQVITADYFLVIPRGQFTYAGSYHDNAVALLLHGRGHAGTIGAELDAKALFVSQAVKPVVALNIAGGGLRTTLNFDTLANGKERSVVLQTRANYAYSLALSSVNASALKLDPEIPGQIWSIPYSLRVNNAPVSLGASALLTLATPQSIDGRENHLLLFRIEDAVDRRAGIYRDSINVNIHVRP